LQNCDALVDSLFIYLYITMFLAKVLAAASPPKPP